VEVGGARWRGVSTRCLACAIEVQRRIRQRPWKDFMTRPNRAVVVELSRSNALAFSVARPPRGERMQARRMKRSHHEVIVITGASGGIGRAAAREFARPGVRIALLARGRRGLESARREVEARGGEALVIPTDVADEAQIETAAAKIEATWGRIDVWV